MVRKSSPPKRPRPSVAKKHKASTAPKPAAETKFTLTPVQKVQVEVIDWKRCSVRSLLLLSYVTLIHLIMYLIVLGYGYSLINYSGWLQAAFYGFFLDLALYFFGSGAALKAITYVWQPLKFILGIIAIILGIIWNVCLYFIGTYNSHKYMDTILPVNVSNAFCKGQNESTDSEHLCREKRSVEIALIFIPFILPPVALICTICACLSAYHGIYTVPKKMNKGQVDAVWLEPYEIYDFYVGRSIPKVTGYDEVADDKSQSHAMSEYFSHEEGEADEEDGDQEEDDGDTTSIASSKRGSMAAGRKSVSSRRSQGGNVEEGGKLIRPSVTLTSFTDLESGGGEGESHLKNRKKSKIKKH